MSLYIAPADSKYSNVFKTADWYHASKLSALQTTWFFVLVVSIVTVEIFCRYSTSHHKHNGQYLHMCAFIQSVHTWSWQAHLCQCGHSKRCCQDGTRVHFEQPLGFWRSIRNVLCAWLEYERVVSSSALAPMTRDKFHMCDSWCIKPLTH